MSRWIDAYNSHPFQTVWDDLQNKFNEIDIKSIQDNDMLVEIARAKKFIKYIDSYLQIVDPELNHANIVGNLNNLQSYANTVISNIQAFINGSQTNLGHLHQLNNALDTFTGQLRALNITIPKVSAPAIRSMLNTYSKTIGDSLKQIDISNTVKASKQIEELRSKLFDTDENHESIEVSIENIFKDFQQKQQELDEFYNDTLNTAEYENTIKEKINKAYKELNKTSEDTNEAYNKFKQQLNEFKEYYYIVFGSEDEDSQKQGLKQELEKLLKSFHSFEQEQQSYYTKFITDKKTEFEKFEEETKILTQKLYEDIKSHLPGATNAGLSYAYKKQKEEYETPIKLWNIAFIISIVLMFFGALLTMFESVNFITLEFKLVHLQTIEDTIKLLLQKLPFYAPLIWFAIYSSKRRSENQRLKQEYAHKEALASSYGSFKKQIEELKEEDQEMLIKLINASIDTVSENASKSLDKKHGDGIPSHELLKEFFDKIKITTKS